MEVLDCHQAIQATLEARKSELSGDVVLFGESYGGFIAAWLAAKYPSSYKVVVLSNPLVDLSSVADMNQFLFWLLGAKNFTQGALADEKMLEDAYERWATYLHEIAA